MGAWGYGPFDSDGAHDFYIDFFDGVDGTARVKAAFNDWQASASSTWGREEYVDGVRAACFLLDRLGFPFVWPGGSEELDELLLTGITALEEISADEVIAGLWGDPDRFRTALDEQIAAMRSRVDERSRPREGR